MRSRDIEEVKAILRMSTHEYLDSLVKRTEIRSKEFRDSGNTKNSVFTDNELLLSLLYIACGRAGEAAFPLGRALANSPEDAQLIGSVLVELERDLPGNADVKFSLGLASFMLGRPEKAEPRFFGCIQLENAPLEQLLKLLESVEEPSPNHQMLVGEILIRMGRTGEGLEQVREYLKTPHAMVGQGSGEGRAGEFFTGEQDSRSFTFERLGLLPADFHANSEIAFMVAGIAAELGKIKEAVEELDNLSILNPESGRDIVYWTGENESIVSSAPAQKLLVKLYLALGDFGRAAVSARATAEMNPSLIGTLLQMAGDALEALPEADSTLLGLMAELHALNGNSESAGEIITRLEEKDTVDRNELFRLTGRILDKCGVTLDRVVSMVDLGLRGNDVAGALPWAHEFMRPNPDAHREFAGRIEALAGADGSEWKEIAALCDTLAQDDSFPGRSRYSRPGHT